MLKEALEKLESLAVQAAGAKVLDIGYNPYRDYVVINGKLEEIDLDPPPRDTRPTTVEDLWAMAEDLLAGSCQSEIWVGTDVVTLIHARADRQDLSKCCFQPSRQYKTAAGLIGGKNFSQAAFVRFLRFDLGAPVETVLPFRRIDWTTKGTMGGSVQKDAAAFGKTIEQEVRGSEPLPDVIRLDMPLFDTPGEREPFRVEYGVEYNHTEQTITICPLPGSLEAALSAHQEDCYRRLWTLAGGETAAANILIFRGSPQ